MAAIGANGVTMGEGNQSRRGCGWAILMTFIGAIVGLVLGGALGGIHLFFYWRGGGHAAGTEAVLVPAYAIPAALLGAAVGLIAALWAGSGKQK